MNITKYEHACVVIAENNQAVVIDPGEFSNSLPLDQTGVVAIVVTHIHGDHLDPAKISTLRAANPDCTLYSTPEVAAAYPDLHVTAVHAGETARVGDFSLEFFGEKHEVIASTDNIAVLVNDRFYYAGDSYVLPGKPVEILAAPASAPWLRMPEATKFVEDIHPRVFFPTHNALLSDIGEQIQYSWFKRVASQTGAEFTVLTPAQYIEI